MTLDEVIRILRRDVRRWKVPVVGWYSPLSILSGANPLPPVPGTASGTVVRPSRRERNDREVLASPNANENAPALKVGASLSARPFFAPAQPGKKGLHHVRPPAPRSPYAVLISCVLSLRTKDRTTHAAAEKLFAVASTPGEMLRLTPRRIEKLIYPVGFYRTKAKNILLISRLLLDRWGGRVPDTIEELLALPGVGRKTANLVVTLGFDKYGICVDTHVHRISNRWGFVKTRTPDETEMELRRKLPRRYWKTFNDLLVTYGQNLCAPISPWCSKCRISSFCRRVGVKTYR